MSRSLLFKILFSIFCFLQLMNCKNEKKEVPTELNTSYDKIVEEDLIVEENGIGRAVWQKPDLVIRELGNISNKVIADIGAGTGYFSFRLALHAKKVIAVDIDTQAIRFLEENKLKLPEKFRENIQIRLAKEDNPLLEENEVDIVLIINTAAYINNLEKYLGILKKGLVQGGEIIIIDYKMKKLPINAPPKEERLYLDKIEDMLEAAGYDQIVTDDTSLDFQYIIHAINNK